MKVVKKKRGRPPKDKGEPRRKNRTFRITDRLDKGMTAFAEASGRSVSEEIEVRLERSVYVDALLTNIVGDEGAILIQMISAAVVLGDVEVNKDPNNLVALQVAIICIIAATGFLPSVPFDPPYDETTLAGLKNAERIVRQHGDTPQVEHFYKIVKDFKNGGAK